MLPARLLALASSVIVGGCGAAAIRAADAKNADRLFTIGGDIYESCSACHQKYLDAVVNANK